MALFIFDQVAIWNGKKTGVTETYSAKSVEEAVETCVQRHGRYYVRGKRSALGWKNRVVFYSSTPPWKRERWNSPIMLVLRNTSGIMEGS